MKNINYKDIIQNYIGLLVSFIIFNILNIILFYNIWILPGFFGKIVYFVALFFVFKLHIKISLSYLKKFLPGPEAVHILKKKQEFLISTIIYLVVYIGANYAQDRNPLFVSYMTTCLLSHFIAYLVYRKKYKKNFVDLKK